jgi:YegS/Rv2252/BmrU family lipid kinase
VEIGPLEIGPLGRSSQHLVLAVFNGIEGADRAVNQLPPPFRHATAAGVMTKGLDEHVRFEEIGLTPKKGAVGGLVVGGLLGLVTGGSSIVLAALGGVVGKHFVSRKRLGEDSQLTVQQVAGSIGPDSSAIVAVLPASLDHLHVVQLEAMGANVYETELSSQAADELTQQGDRAHEELLSALADFTGGRPVADVPYRRIHVVINPVSGKDEPIINVLNSVFHRHGVDWDCSITHQYGDATELARQAANDGFDLVAGYGGDGTQHEVAIGLLGTAVTMGVLPGGTGNGFANELGTPVTLREAAQLLCVSHNRRKIDVARVGDGYFVQRLFTGIEPDEQTSREDKNKYGTFAYLKRDIHRLGNIADIPYRLTIDGEEIEVMGHKCYVVNSATAGTGFSIAERFEVDDGVLDVFMLSRDPASRNAAIDRFLNLDTERAGAYYWRGANIVVDADPDQPVWTDGEYYGRTPVAIEVVPGALTIAVP